MNRLAFSILSIALAGLATPAAAYVGPGAGISMLGALWGLVVAIAAALGFILLWPLRRFIFKGRRAEARSAGEKGRPPGGRS